MPLCVAGIGLAAVLLVPSEGRSHPGPGGASFHYGGHQKDFASRTFRLLLHNQKDFNLSAEQVGKIESLAADYAKTRIRNQAAVELAEVDVRSLIKNPQSELSAIEAALRKSEAATTIERLDRVKAIRTALAVLTPEQRESWKTKMRAPRHHGDGHHGPTCGNGPSRHESAVNQDTSVGARS
jgi:Spy/CpxP family protein refolding chaperone